MSVPIFFLHNFAQKEDGERLDFPDILLENDFKRLYLQITKGNMSCIPCRILIFET